MSIPVVRFAAVRDVPADPALLSPAETARHDRLRRPADRAAYLAAHVLVRECVAALLGVAAQTVRIEQRCARCAEPGHGAPSVAGHPQVGVSLSHSTRHVAAAAALGRVGIDVETLDDERITPEVLTAAERRWLSNQPDPARAFRRLWVCKEALIKTGVADLQDVARLDVVGGAPGRRLRTRTPTCTEWSAGDAVGAWVVR